MASDHLRLSQRDIGANEKFKGVRGSAGVIFRPSYDFAHSYLKIHISTVLSWTDTKRKSECVTDARPWPSYATASLEIWQHNCLVLQLTTKIFGLNFDLQCNSLLFKPGHA